MSRPIQFNQTKVIQSAMTLFFRHGYTATSMSILLTTTGLKSGSLYASFGSKQGLFEAAIDYYASTTLQKLTEQLNCTDNFVENIRNAISATIDGSLACEPHGCFLTNSIIELAPHNESIKLRVQGHLGNVEQAYIAALNKAKEAGQLPEDLSVERKVTKIMISLWGICVFQRTGLDAQQVYFLKELYEEIV